MRNSDDPDILDCLSKAHERNDQLMRERGELESNEKDQETRGATVYELTESEQSSVRKKKEERKVEISSKEEELRLERLLKDQEKSQEDALKEQNKELKRALSAQEELEKMMADLDAKQAEL